MPSGVCFPYHTLDPEENAGPFAFIGPNAAEPVCDPARAGIGNVPQLLRQAKVARIILVHGTFAGNDIVGLARELTRFSPALADKLSAIGKKWIDDLVGELGNYTQEFVDCFSGLINPKSLQPIPVTRFHWSGENHHLGRADGVMTLLDLLAGAPSEGRVLVFAHSHGGNVMAMMSQLLAADASIRQQFFAATRLHYQSPLWGRIDLPIWQGARERLVDEQATQVDFLDQDGNPWRLVLTP